jgi:hypothetical protein
MAGYFLMLTLSVWTLKEPTLSVPNKIAAFRTTNGTN